MTLGAGERRKYTRAWRLVLLLFAGANGSPRRAAPSPKSRASACCSCSRDKFPVVLHRASACRPRYPRRFALRREIASPRVADSIPANNPSRRSAAEADSRAERDVSLRDSSSVGDDSLPDRLEYRSLNFIVGGKMRFPKVINLQREVAAISRPC